MKYDKKIYKYSIYNIDIRVKKNIIVYNTSTGSLCELEKEIFDKIYQKDDISNQIDYFDNLVEQGIIVDKELDEYNRIICEEEQCLKSKCLEKISDVCALTLNCNMNCIYCFEAKNKNCIKITGEIVEGIINYMKKQISYPTVKSFSISWFGGEPMLEYEKMIYIGKKMKTYCKQNNIEFSSTMISNGLLLTSDRLDNLIKECNLKSIQITLDGTKEYYCKLKQVSEDLFDKLIQNICNACTKVNTIIRLNTNKENLVDLEKLIVYLFDTCKLENRIRIYLAEIKDYTKSNCASFASLEFEKLKREFYVSLYKKYNYDFINQISKREIRKTTCAYIRGCNAIFGPKGEIYKCEHNIGNPDCVVGNVFDGLFYNEEYIRYNAVSHYSKCKKCRLFPMCLSGCKNHQLLFKEKDAVDCKGILNSLKAYLKNIYLKNQNK